MNKAVKGILATRLIVGLQDTYWSFRTDWIAVKGYFTTYLTGVLGRPHPRYAGITADTTDKRLWQMVTMGAPLPILPKFQGNAQIQEFGYMLGWHMLGAYRNGLRINRRLKEFWKPKRGCER
ncbi:hypothetical protein DWV16_08860 [Anaerotruncus sp. AF02-27]|uniref:hypothetical protein n=1 Tax=Anaerotruncus sp. AF02-27 TaxID=2292191 RepID=UPI000E4AF828|nr:hypothetical protein [Anaerotruncus sp. AF02-27]RGX55322.1 hypothetical protein DWV16_08860 [Anaerotruncus sp. AF02-27]